MHVMCIPYMTFDGSWHIAHPHTHSFICNIILSIVVDFATQKIFYFQIPLKKPFELHMLAMLDMFPVFFLATLIYLTQGLFLSISHCSRPIVNLLCLISFIVIYCSIGI